MIGYLGSKKFQLNKINKDDHGRILIIDANIDDQNLVLINFYNANTELEQMNSICELNPLSAKFIKWSNTLKQIVGKLPTICLSVFDHFSGLAFKGLINY